MGTVTKRWLNLGLLKFWSLPYQPWNLDNLTFKINFLLLFSFLTLQIPGIKYPRYPQPTT